MSYNQENVNMWLWQEVMAADNPRLFFWCIEEAIEHVEDMLVEWESPESEPDDS